MVIRRRQPRPLGGASVALVLALTLAACGDDDSSSDAPSRLPADPSTTAVPREETPQRGGTLTILMQEDGRTLDPAGINTLNAASGDGFRLYAIFDALLTQDPRTGDLTYRLAESLSSTDAINWRLKLRPGVRFTDGTPFDAAAVKFNWERHLDPANQSPSISVVRSIAAMTVVDPLTLDITLASPQGQFPRIVAKRLAAIGSPTAMQRLGAQFASQPVGAGPFVLEEWVRDSRLVLARNQAYWDAPRPYVDELVFRVVPDATQRTDTLRAGQAHLAYSTIPQSAEQAEDAGLTVVRYSPNAGRAWLLNHERPPFDDVRVRRALAYAFDAGNFVRTVESGLGVPIDILFGQGSPFHEPSLRIPAFDQQAAQRLFDEYAREHGPIRFTASTTATSRDHIEYLQAQLAKFDNVEVEVAIIQQADYPRILQQGDFQAVVYALQLNDPDPDMYDNFHSTSSRNFSGYANPEMDEALTVGHVSLDPAARARAYRRVQEILLEEQPYVWYVKFQQFLLVAPDVRGVETFEDVLPNVERIWLAQ